MFFERKRKRRGGIQCQGKRESRAAADAVFIPLHSAEMRKKKFDQVGRARENAHGAGDGPETTSRATLAAIGHLEGRRNGRLK